jgi:thioredoxin-like negative regulator of GroEL
MIEQLNDDNLWLHLFTNQRVVVRLYSDYSALCNAFEASYKSIAKENKKSIQFIDVDDSENPNSVNAIGAYSLPFVGIYEEGELKEKFSTPNLSQLHTMIQNQIT